MALLSLRYGYHLSQVTQSSELSLLSFLMCLTDRAAAVHQGTIRFSSVSGKTVQLQVVIYCQVCRESRKENVQVQQQQHTWLGDWLGSGKETQLGLSEISWHSKTPPKMQPPAPQHHHHPFTN